MSHRNMTLLVTGCVQSWGHVSHGAILTDKNRVLFPEPTPSPQGWQRDFPTESEGVWCFAGCPVSVLSQHLRGTPQVSAMVLTGLILAFLVGCLYLALV